MPDNIGPVSNDDGRFRQRAWYFSKVYADPKSADTVYLLNTGLFRSVDGGKTFNLLPARHGDHHGFWIDPQNPNRIANANDGGASISIDGGKTWTTQNNQPTAQFYHVSVDNAFPYHIYGAQQDNTSVGIASRTDWGAIGPRRLVRGRQRRVRLCSGRSARLAHRLFKQRKLYLSLQQDQGRYAGRQRLTFGQFRSRCRRCYSSFSVGNAAHPFAA